MLSRWGGYLVEIHRVKHLSSFIGSPTPTPPSRAGYLGAISSRYIFELKREERLTRRHAPQLFSIEPNHSQTTQLFSIELKYVTHSIPTRYPPKDGIRGVEVPPSGRDLGWEKKSLEGIRAKKSPTGIKKEKNSLRQVAPTISFRGYRACNEIQ